MRPYKFPNLAATKSRVKMRLRKCLQQDALTDATRCIDRTLNFCLFVTAMQPSLGHLVPPLVTSVRNEEVRSHLPLARGDFLVENPTRLKARLVEI